MPAIRIRNVKNRGRTHLFRLATEWMLAELNCTRFRDLDLHISLTNLKETLKCTGLCEWTCDEENYREFIIMIDNKQSLKEQLRSLAHELVHVKQYLKNELYDYSRNTSLVRWQKEIVDCDKIKYRQQPWEQEAYRMQSPLLRKFLRENGIDLELY